MGTPSMADEILAAVGALEPRSTAALRAVRRQFSKRIAKDAASDVIAVARALYGRPGIPRFVADELIFHHSGTVACLSQTTLEELGDGMNSWGDVDCFACYLAGPAWRAGTVTDAVVHGWARSPNRWWRRAALVSTVPLNVPARGGTGDTERTLAICRALVDDRDDMVVKALSWALRELVRHDAPAVQRFVAEHEPRLAPRVIREVQHKLETGLKNPRSQKGRRGGNRE